MCIIDSHVSLPGFVVHVCAYGTGMSNLCTLEDNDSTVWSFFVRHEITLSHYCSWFAL